MFYLHHYHPGSRYLQIWIINIPKIILIQIFFFSNFNVHHTYLHHIEKIYRYNGRCSIWNVHLAYKRKYFHRFRHHCNVQSLIYIKWRRKKIQFIHLPHLVKVWKWNGSFCWIHVAFFYGKLSQNWKPKTMKIKISTESVKNCTHFQHFN